MLTCPVFAGSEPFEAAREKAVLAGEDRIARVAHPGGPIRIWPGPDESDTGVAILHRENSLFASSFEWSETREHRTREHQAARTTWSRSSTRTRREPTPALEGQQRTVQEREIVATTASPTRWNISSRR